MTFYILWYNLGFFLLGNYIYPIAIQYLDVWLNLIRIILVLLYCSNEYWGRRTALTGVYERQMGRDDSFECGELGLGPRLVLSLGLSQLSQLSAHVAQLLLALSHTAQLSLQPRHSAPALLVRILRALPQLRQLKRNLIQLRRYVRQLLPVLLILLVHLQPNTHIIESRHLPVPIELIEMWKNVIF